MNPLVSILIPAFNAERWVAQSIESGLNQTWKRTEIVVVDDGSRDNTYAVAKRRACKRVKVVTQSNAGAAAARNHAFDLCQGDYIQWLDADDLLAPDKVASQVRAAAETANPRILFSSAGGYFFWRPHKTRFVPTPLWIDSLPVDWLVKKFEENSFMQSSAWLVSRELGEMAGPWDTRLSLDDDGEYFCRILLQSVGIRFVSEAKVYYRRNPSSLSRLDLSDRKWESQFLSIALQIQHLRARDNSKRVRAALVKHLQDYTVYFYPERPDLLQKAEELAAGLGGTLVRPRLPRKYAWIEALLGSRAAKRAQFRYTGWKIATLGAIDRAFLALENGAAFAKSGSR
jgi:glycosyltransferase involved in cell wall biosynthesis